jgi:autotransporter-associated beta strand protein
MQLLSWLSARMTRRPKARRATLRRPVHGFNRSAVLRLEVLEDRRVPASLQITPVNPSVPVGTGFPFHASETDDFGHTTDVTTSVTWMTSPQSGQGVIVSSGPQAGLFTGLSGGTVLIQATDTQAAGGPLVAHDVVTVMQDPTATQLVLSSNPLVLGQPLTITATVIPTSPSAQTLTGKMEFRVLRPDNTTTVSTVDYINGGTKFTIPGLGPVGNFQITATYKGDVNFSGSQSTTQTLVVRKAMTLTWSGLGPDNLWSDGANWVGGVAPSPGDSLVFPESAPQHDNVNDLAPGTFFQSLRITGSTGLSGYSMSGNRVAIGSGGLRNENYGPGDTIAFDVTGTGPTLFISASFFLTLRGTVSGAGQLVKTGTGELELDGNNTYTGTTLIEQGELFVGSATALGSAGAGTIVEANGTLALADGSVISEALQFQAPTRGLDRLLVYGDATLAGPMLLQSSTRMEVFGGNCTVTGPISGPGGLVINPGRGDGTFTLTGNNSYRSPTTLSAGVLNVRNGGALGVAGNSVIVNKSATLDLRGGLTFPNPVHLAGTLRSSGGDNTLTGPMIIPTAETKTVEVDEDSLRVTGRISSVGAGATLIANLIAIASHGRLLKTGDGTLVLGGENNYHGTTEIDAGVLESDTATALGTSIVTVKDGGTLDLFGGFTVSNALFIAGIGADGQGALREDGGTMTILAGGITLDDTALITVAGGSNLEVNGKPVAGPDTASLLKNGAGSLLLATANTSYLGPTSILEGTVFVGNNTALGPAGSASTDVMTGASLVLFSTSRLTIDEPLTLDGQGSSAAPLVNLKGFNVLKGPITLLSTSTIDVSALLGASTLELDGSIDSMPGANLIKTGGGLFVLTGDSSAFAGTMALEAGHTQIKGASIGGSIVVDGGVLQADAGGFVASLTLNAASLVLGDPAGTSLQINDLTLTSVATFSYLANTPPLIVTGNLTLGGALIIKPKTLIGKKFTLIQSQTAASGAFDVPAGFDVSYSGGDSGHDVTEKQVS